MKQPLFLICWKLNMKKKNQNRLNLLLMATSMIILCGFLTYWLIGEYESEKKKIELERTSNFFEGIIVALESDSVSEIKFRDPFLGKSNEFLTMKIDSSRDTLLRIQKFDSLHTKYEFKTYHEFPEQFKILGDDSVSIKTRLMFNEETNEMDTIINIDMNAKYPINTSKPIFVERKINIFPVVILKRLIPQFLISILILSSVLFTFYMLRKTLIKQQKLSMIKDDFVANMTHELKTPVSTIGVALEALRNFGAGENPRLREEYMDITISEVNRLGLLVDKALNISLFEKGKVHFDKDLVDLGQEIEKIDQTLKVYHEHNNIQFKIQKTGQNFWVQGDRTHMVNVIHNLIENAIKYSEDDKNITLEIEEHERSVKLHVKDRGVGIAKEEQYKIFDKFYRVSKGNVHDTKGHGLGLSYVKMAVEEMGGNITVESVPGVGSDFILTFPKAKK